jgi:hypothetical protein
MDLQVMPHKWTHSFVDRFGAPSYEVSFTSYKESATELAEDFASYLMGCGFFQSTIIEAFDDYISEHRQALIDSGERLAKTMVGEGE